MQALNPTLDRDRFVRLWRRVGGDHTDAVFSTLADHYREPHRHYHTGAHINDCLARMDAAAAVLGASDAVELAVWFHDVIYTAGDPDNEGLSADWFADKAAGGLPRDLVHEVAAHIVATEHKAPPVTDGAKFVVDVDLSGLGMESDAFNRDGDNIRKEFPGLSEAEFIRGQECFLQGLLDRERIFSTGFFFDLCEANARRNIIQVLQTHTCGG